MDRMLRNLVIAAAVLVGSGASVATGLGLQTAATAQPTAEVSVCPSRLESQVPSLICECTPDSTASGTVWGTDVYTDDSPICRAAVHAGVIGPRGGVIDVYESRGLSSYDASTRNGVDSSSWGSYPRSFQFRDRGAPPPSDK
jgi:hypothetical protein